MNVQRLIANMLVAAFTSSVMLGFVQKANADLFCYPWESGCNVDGRPGSSGNNPLGVPRDGFIIYVTNNTGKTIFVTIRAYYSDPGNESCSKLNQNIPAKDQSLVAYTGEKLLINPTQKTINSGNILLARCASSGWQTYGTWTFSPGERARVLNGSARITGRNATFKAYSQDGSTWEKEVDMGSTIGEFNFTFR